MGTRRNLNMKANYYNSSKKNQLNGFDESSVIDWDDPIEIESRDADSISEYNNNSNNQKFLLNNTFKQQPIQQRKRQQQLKQQQEQSNQKNKPKLYTFYDYIPKNKEENFNNANSPSFNHIKSSVYNNNNNSPNLNNKKSFDYSRNQVLNINNNNLNQNPRTQSYRLKQKEEALNQEEEEEETLITQMPISSGFGGYTGTTRRKPQPKKTEKVITVSPRKPIRFQPVYRVNSDDDLLSGRKTVFIEDEPEEEVVHVVHRPKPKPKEKIIYIDEEPQQSQPNIVYVDRPPSPQYVYAKPPAPTTQYVYAQAAPQPQPQLVSVQQQPQYVISTSGTRTAPQQVVLMNEPVQQQQQIQYVIPNQEQYIQTVQAQPQYYYDQIGSGSGNYVILNDQVAPTATNYVTTLPTSNIIYR